MRKAIPSNPKLAYQAGWRDAVTSILGRFAEHKDSLLMPENNAEQKQLTTAYDTLEIISSFLDFQSATNSRKADK